MTLAHSIDACLAGSWEVGFGMRYLQRACTKQVLLPALALLVLIALGIVYACGRYVPGARSVAVSSAPLFIENAGQLDKQVRFLGWRLDRTLWLTPQAIWVTVWDASSTSSAGVRRGVNLRLTFVGANPQPRMEAFQRQGAHVSYLAGQQADTWQVDVPVWAGVRYIDIYPGIDLEIGGEQSCGWRLVVRDPDRHWPLTAVSLQVDGAAALAIGGEEEYPYLSITTEAGIFALPLLQVTGPDGKPLAADPQVPMRAEGNLVTAPFSQAGGAPAGVDLLCGAFGGEECRQQAGKQISGWLDRAAPTVAGAFSASGQTGNRFAVQMDAGCGLAQAVFAAGVAAADLQPAGGATGVRTAATGSSPAGTVAAGSPVTALPSPTATVALSGTAAASLWATAHPGEPIPTDYYAWPTDDSTLPTDEPWPTDAYPWETGDYTYPTDAPSNDAYPWLTESAVPSSTPTPTPTPTATPTATLTVAPTPTGESSQAAAPTPTSTPTLTAAARS